MKVRDTPRSYPITRLTRTVLRISQRYQAAQLRKLGERSTVSPIARRRNPCHSSRLRDHRLAIGEKKKRQRVRRAYRRDKRRSFQYTR